MYLCRQNNFIMMTDSFYKVKDWINYREKRGDLTFSYKEVEKSFPAITSQAVKNALVRLVKKTAIMSVWKGFYSIIPVGYALRGTVPPELYIDYLMKYLNRHYYVSLLNAAVFYGAAHQQPQDFSVINSYPPLRNTIKKENRIIFSATRKIIPQNWLKSFRTEYGDIKVSSPELTTADLITFQKEVGGLNRACTVIYELAENLNFEILDKSYFDFVPTSTIQRLGYLLENELGYAELANILFKKTEEFNCIFQKIPLKTGKSVENCETNSRWKILINEQIEIDEY